MRIIQIKKKKIIKDAIIEMGGESEEIDKIDEILNDFEDFEQPTINKSGDIIIKKKLIKRKTNDSSILTNIFKEMIKNDVKKNRV